MLAIAAIFLSLITPTAVIAKAQSVDLFNSTSVSEITIHLSQKDLASIAAEPKTSVKAKFDIVNTSTNHGFKFSGLPIDFHLKGSSTLKQNPSLLNNRPSMRVKFKAGGFLKLGFLGTLKSLTLNSMSQDSSMIHEYSAYKLFNAMGVPAPRVGYATVKLQLGDKTIDKGLFAIIEPYDDVFLNNRFNTPTQHLYENCGLWANLNREGTARGGETCTDSVFEVKEGWAKTPNKDDLQALVTAQKIRDNDAWWLALDRYTDRNELIRMWAVSNYISNWDSYSGPTVNNFYLRSDRMGVFTMHPFGTDESFGGSNEYNFDMDAPAVGYPWIYRNFKIGKLPRGDMFVRCLSYEPCHSTYIKELGKTSATAKKINLAQSMADISSTIADYSEGWSKGLQTSAQNWLTKKDVDVEGLLVKYGF